MNQVTRHPSSIGSDKPSKDPEIRQVRKLHSNAQKVKKEFKKKQKAKGTGQKPTLKLNLPYPETVCCLFKEANHETIEESSGMQASKNPPKNCHRNTEPNLYGVYPATGGGPSQHKGVLACLVLSCVKHALEFHIQDCSTCVLSRVATSRHSSRCLILDCGVE